MGDILEELASAEISNAITLERVKLSLAKEALAKIEEIERGIIADLAAINPAEPTREIYRQARLEKALANAQAISRQLYSEANKGLAAGLVGAATVNQKAFAKAVESLLGVDLIAGDLSTGALLQIAKGSLVNGAITADWFSRQSAKLIQDYGDTLTEGLARGEGISSLLRRVRGTREAAYTDGIFGVARNNARALVNTSAQTVLQEARLEQYRENKDLIKGVQWLSTLDRRTSGICKALSGSTWDLEGKPINARSSLRSPPAHWGCRSTLLSLLKSWEELSASGQMRLPGTGRGNFEALFREKLQKRGLPADKIEGAVLSAKKRMTGATSPVKMNYSDWLKGQTPEAQREALGAGRYKLYSAGKIQISDLINGQLTPLSVKELQALSL